MPFLFSSVSRSWLARAVVAFSANCSDSGRAAIQALSASIVARWYLRAVPAVRASLDEPQEMSHPRQVKRKSLGDHLPDFGDQYACLSAVCFMRSPHETKHIVR